jgi:hypothetical protein
LPYRRVTNRDEFADKNSSLMPKNKLIYLESFLACPARFERATYALEAVKMSRNNKLGNDIEVLKSGVA